MLSEKENKELDKFFTKIKKDLNENNTRFAIGKNLVRIESRQDGFYEEYYYYIDVLKISEPKSLGVNVMLAPEIQDFDDDRNL